MLYSRIILSLSALLITSSVSARWVQEGPTTIDWGEVTRVTVCDGYSLKDGSRSRCMREHFESLRRNEHLDKDCVKIYDAQTVIYYDRGSRSGWEIDASDYPQDYTGPIPTHAMMQAETAPRYHAPQYDYKDRTYPALAIFLPTFQGEFDLANILILNPANPAGSNYRFGDGTPGGATGRSQKDNQRVLASQQGQLVCFEGNRKGD